MITIVAQPSAGGPTAYGLCQAACAAGVVVCYAAAGFVFGTITGGRTSSKFLFSCTCIMFIMRFKVFGRVRLPEWSHFAGIQVSLHSLYTVQYVHYAVCTLYSTVNKNYLNAAILWNFHKLHIRVHGINITSKILQGIISQGIISQAIISQFNIVIISKIFH